MRFATCHKDRKHYAKNLCEICYHRSKKRKVKDASAEKSKNRSYIRRYGITTQQVIDMKNHQKNRCAICNGIKELHVDHHHDTDTVRGLLCGTCNRGIGSLGESVDTLLAAVKYLMYWANKYKGKPNV